MSGAKTLGDLRWGSNHLGEPACKGGNPLWAALDLDETTPVATLRERWTLLAACWLALADGRGPRCGAVSWVDHVLGTNVLRGADLRRVDLRGAYLGGANLRGADLVHADLSNACLEGARLDGAELGFADLSNANLSFASLAGADLSYARLRGACLRSANLRGSYLHGATTEDAIFHGARVGATHAPPGWETAWGDVLRQTISEVPS